MEMTKVYSIKKESQAAWATALKSAVTMPEIRAALAPQNDGSIHYHAITDTEKAICAQYGQSLN